MFQHIIQKLNSLPNKSYIACKPQQEKFLIIKVKTSVASQFYAVNLNEIIDEGTFGIVFQAYALSEQGDIQFNKPYALKVLSQNDFNSEEIKIASRYYEIKTVIHAQNEVWILEEYLPGINLDEAFKQYQFTFLQMLEIFWKIALNLNLMHHRTPQTGPAIVHADLKFNNIKLQYDELTKKINVYVFDFGLTEETKDNPNKLKNGVTGKGSLYYIAPEVYSGKYGIKSDIYSLTPIFLQCLHAINPFRYKADLDNPELSHGFHTMKVANINFDFTGIFSNLLIPEKLTFMKEIIIKFLMRMQSMDYDLRPNSDELLRFTTSLYNLGLLLQANSEDNKQIKKHTKILETLVETPSPEAAEQETVFTRNNKLSLTAHR